MKQFNFLQHLLLMVVVVVMASCSKNEKDLYDYVNDGDMIVLSMNVYNIMDNAGFKFSSDGVEVPAAFKRLVSSNNEVIDILTSVKGVDPRMVLVSVPSSADLATALVKVTDINAFGKSLENQGLKKSTKGEYTVYQNDGLSIIIDGDVAILLSEDDESTKIVDQLKQKAQNDPIAKWKKELLNQDHACTALLNYSVISELYTDATGQPLQLDHLNAYYDGDVRESTIVTDLTLDGLVMQMTYRMCKPDGSELKSTVPLTPLDKSMLKYTDAKDVLVALLSVPLDQPILDYINSYIDQSLGSDAEAVKTLLSLVSGKMEISFGYTSIASFGTGQGLVGSLALEAKDGNSQALFDYIKTLLDQTFMPYVTVSPTCIRMPINVNNVYVMIDGANVVISLSDKFNPEGCVITSSDFSDVPVEMIAKIPARNSNMTLLSLPFALEMKAIGDENGSVLSFTMTETEGRFLENLFKAIP